MTSNRTHCPPSYRRRRRHRHRLIKHLIRLTETGFHAVSTAQHTQSVLIVPSYSFIKDEHHSNDFPSLAFRTEPMGKVILTFWLSDKLNGIRQWNGKAYYYIYTEWYTHFSGNFYTIVLRRISRMFEMNSNWQIGATKAPYWNHINNNFAIEYLLNNNVSKQDEKTNWEHSLFAVLWLRNRICNVWSDHVVMLTEFRVRIFLTHGKVLSFFFTFCFNYLQSKYQLL